MEFLAIQNLSLLETSKENALPYASFSLGAMLLLFFLPRAPKWAVLDSFVFKNRTQTLIY